MTRPDLIVTRVVVLPAPQVRALSPPGRSSSSVRPIGLDGLLAIDAEGALAVVLRWAPSAEGEGGGFAECVRVALPKPSSRFRRRFRPFLAHAVETLAVDTSDDGTVTWETRVVYALAPQHLGLVRIAWRNDAGVEEIPAIRPARATATNLSEAFAATAALTDIDDWDIRSLAFVPADVPLNSGKKITTHHSDGGTIAVVHSVVDAAETSVHLTMATLHIDLPDDSPSHGASVRLRAGPCVASNLHPSTSLVRTIRGGPGGWWGCPGNVSSDATIVFVASTHGVLAFDPADPSSAARRIVFSPPLGDTPVAGWCLSDDRLLLCGARGSVYAVDLGDAVEVEVDASGGEVKGGGGARRTYTLRVDGANDGAVVGERDANQNASVSSASLLSASPTANQSADQSEGVALVTCLLIDDDAAGRAVSVARVSRAPARGRSAAWRVHESATGGDGGGSWKGRCEDGRRRVGEAIRDAARGGGGGGGGGCGGSGVVLERRELSRVSAHVAEGEDPAEGARDCGNKTGPARWDALSAAAVPGCTRLFSLRLRPGPGPDTHVLLSFDAADRTVAVRVEGGTARECDGGGGLERDAATLEACGGMHGLALQATPRDVRALAIGRASAGDAAETLDVETVDDIHSRVAGDSWRPPGGEGGTITHAAAAGSRVVAAAHCGGSATLHYLTWGASGVCELCVVSIAERHVAAVAAWCSDDDVCDADGSGGGKDEKDKTCFVAYATFGPDHLVTVLRASNAAMTNLCRCVTDRGPCRSLVLFPSLETNADADVAAEFVCWNLLAGTADGHLSHLRMRLTLPRQDHGTWICPAMLGRDEACVGEGEVRIQRLRLDVPAGSSPTRRGRTVMYLVHCDDGAAVLDPSGVPMGKQSGGGEDGDRGGLTRRLLRLEGVRARALGALSMGEGSAALASVCSAGGFEIDAFDATSLLRACRDQFDAFSSSSSISSNGFPAGGSIAPWSAWRGEGDEFVVIPEGGPWGSGGWQKTVSGVGGSHHGGYGSEQAVAVYHRRAGRGEGPVSSVRLPSFTRAMDVSSVRVRLAKRDLGSNTGGVVSRSSAGDDERMPTVTAMDLVKGTLAFGEDPGQVGSSFEHARDANPREQDFVVVGGTVCVPFDECTGASHDVVTLLGFSRDPGPEGSENEHVFRFTARGSAPVASLLPAG